MHIDITKIDTLTTACAAVIFVAVLVCSPLITTDAVESVALSVTAAIAVLGIDCVRFDGDGS